MGAEVAQETAVVASEGASPPVPATVPAAREAFQTEYLGILGTKRVKDNIRRALAEGSPKEVRDILSVLLPALLPQEKDAGSKAPTKITFINRVGSKAVEAVDVTPGRS